MQRCAVGYTDTRPLNRVGREWDGRGSADRKWAEIAC